jgi:hypothetical protein
MSRWRKSGDKRGHERGAGCPHPPFSERFGATVTWSGMGAVWEGRRRGLGEHRSILSQDTRKASKTWLFREIGEGVAWDVAPPEETGGGWHRPCPSPSGSPACFGDDHRAGSEVRSYFVRARDAGFSASLGSKVSGGTRGRY